MKRDANTGTISEEIRNKDGSIITVYYNEDIRTVTLAFQRDEECEKVIKDHYETPHKLTLNEFSDLVKRIRINQMKTFIYEPGIEYIRLEK